MDNLPPPPPGYQVLPPPPEGYVVVKHGADLREQYKDEIRRGVDNVLPAPGIMGSIQRVMSDPLGLQDEVVGAGRYIGKLVRTGGDTEAANRAYEEGAERIRAEKEIARERLGWGGNLAAQLTGGFGTTGAGSAIANAPTWLARVGQSAKAGAQYGTAAGFGNAEGGFANRLIGAGEGALEGAVIAPALSEVALPILNSLPRTIMNSPTTVSNAVRTVIPGTRENIDNRLLTNLRRDQKTPADLRTQMTQDQANATFGGTTMDIPLTLADSGPNMQNLAYTIKAQPGEAATEAKRVLEGRQRGENGFSSQYDRMSEATRRSLKVTRDNAVRAEDALTEGRANDANQAYDAFRSFPGTIPVEDILQSHAHDVASGITTGSKLAKEVDAAYEPFVDEPHVIGTVQGPSRTEEARHNLQQMAIDTKIAKAQEAGNTGLAGQLQNLKQGLRDQFAAKTRDTNLTGPTSELTPAKFDNAKKQLDDMIGTAQRAGDNYKVSILSDLKNRLIKRANEVTTVQGPSGPVSLYKQARESYSTPTQTLEALESGRNFQKVDPDRIKQEYGDLNTPQQRAYRIGAANTVVSKFGDKASGANVAAQLDTPNVQTRLSALTTGPNLAKLNAIAEQENRMAQTRNRVMGGSKTNENQNNTQDFTLMTRIGDRLKSGSPLAAIGDAVATGIAKLYRYREQDARLLARDLFATDPAQREATIARLEATYGKTSVSAAVRQAQQIAQQYTARVATGPLIGNFLSASPNSSPQNRLLSSGQQP